jgi:hypothetical protein
MIAFKNGVDYFKKHPAYHGIVHGIGGIGVGILIASPLAGIHPVRWGVAFMAIALLGHLYAASKGKG